MFAQPPIAAPWFANVTVPHSAVLLAPAVTVAIKVTLWFVTGADGVASRAVVVGCEEAGIGDAMTTAVFAVFTDVLPPRPVAVTTHRIVLPTSALDRA
jgi:hypothetical protein